MTRLSKRELTLGCVKIVASYGATVALLSVADYAPQLQPCEVLQERSVSAMSDYAQDYASAVADQEILRPSCALPA
jgi:hypothetical protein